MGLTKANQTSFKKGNIPWHTGTKGKKPAPSTAFKKGCVGWSLGKKLPFRPHPWKIGQIPKSAFQKGNKSWNEGIKVEAITGENHYRWTGGTYDKDRKVDMGRKLYREWRKAVFDRDNCECIFCGSTENLNADHIKPYALFPELRYEVSNGRTLCQSCHKLTDTYGSKIKLVKIGENYEV